MNTLKLQPLSGGSNWSKCYEVVLEQGILKHLHIHLLVTNPCL